MTPVIRTERLMLRPPAESDLERIVDLIGDYDVSKMLALVPHPYTRDHGIDWLSQANTGKPGCETVFALDAGDGLIGCVSLGKLPNDPTLGYWLGRPYWGRGYMSEAAGAALAWLFANHPIDELTSQAMDENPASLKVLRKLGFSDDSKGTCESLARGEGRPSTVLRIKRNAFN
ncbi:GNAT family N-acetyltransferase [uncultured Roseibium sp.]|uniref:GNAT family N-acetyltransferase n=1 Tax=uncultured Roseibium sp. TaxID=1936171 RepID=UPI003217B5E1